MPVASSTSAAEETAAQPATPWSRKQRLILRIARALVPRLLRALGRTWRWELPNGVPDGAFTDPPQAAIYVFWHRCLLPMAWFARGRGFGVLVSQHFDGEVISQIAECMGYRLFRGSSTRGGRDALASMQEALEAGRAIALTVDGPRGPRFQAKGGAIQLAKATGAPIYALHISPRSCWTLRSWDRLQIPKPWTRLRGVWAGPLPLLAEGDLEASESARLAMEALLNQLRVSNDRKEEDTQ